MTIKTKLTEKAYINACFATIVARPFIRYFLSIVSIILLINVISTIARGSTLLSTLLPPIIIFVIYLSFIYFSVKSAYSTNTRISENIEYTFLQNDLLIVGESFKTELSWNKIYRVTKSKYWLLIWQTGHTANAIPKKNLLEEELIRLKVILADNRVKNNL